MLSVVLSVHVSHTTQINDINQDIKVVATGPGGATVTVSKSNIFICCWVFFHLSYACTSLLKPTQGQSHLLAVPTQS